MKRIIASTIAGLLLATAGAGAANATEAPPATVTVLWEMPTWAGDRTATWNQKFVAEAPGTNLAAFDTKIEGLKCGYYQVDVYYDTPENRAMWDDGVLYPGEDHGEGKLIPGGWDVAYKLIKGGDGSCGGEPPLTPTFDEFCGTENDRVNVPSDGAYSVIGSVAEGGATVTYTYPGGFVQTGTGASTVSWYFEFSNEPCPPIVVPPVDPPADPPVDEPEVPVTPLPEVVDPPVVVDPKPVAAPVAPAPATEPLTTLPETGPVEDALLSVLAVGLMLLVAGFSVWLGGKTKHHRYDKRSK